VFVIDTHPVPAIALPTGAQVTVVAHDAFAKVLFAHAGYTDTGSTVPVAGTTLVPSTVPAATPARIAVIFGALVAVVAVETEARILFTDAVYADAGNAVPVAVATLRKIRLEAARTAGNAVIGAIVAIVPGALVAVVAVLVG
jgi:hypothetical protein